MGSKIPSLLSHLVAVLSELIPGRLYKKLWGQRLCLVLPTGSEYSTTQEHLRSTYCPYKPMMEITSAFAHQFADITLDFLSVSQSPNTWELWKKKSMVGPLPWRIYGLNRETNQNSKDNSTGQSKGHGLWSLTDFSFKLYLCHLLLCDLGNP